MVVLSPDYPDCVGPLSMSQFRLVSIAMLLLSTLRNSYGCFESDYVDSVEYETCPKERNCTARFPGESGISCLVHHGEICSSQTVSKMTDSPGNQDYLPFLKSLAIPKREGHFGIWVEGNLTFSFLVTLEDVYQGKVQGVKVEFQTRDAENDYNCYYSENVICRYFELDLDAGKKDDVTEELDVEIPYSCIGIAIVPPDDFQLTLTSVPTSQQLVYDVKWAYRFKTPKNATWMAEVLAVTSVRSQGIVHVVFEPPNSTTGVSGVKVDLVKDTTIVQSERVHIGKRGIFFRDVETGVYTVELTAFGGRCYTSDHCGTLTSHPFEVERPIVKHQDNASSNDWTTILVTCVVSVVGLLVVIGAVSCACRRRKKALCRLSRPPTILVVSCSVRPLEIDLLTSLRRLVDSNLTNAHVTQLCPFQDGVSSPQSSYKGEHDEGFFLFQPDSSDSSIADTKKFAAVLFLMFDCFPAETKDKETSSLLAPHHQMEVDFLNQIRLDEIKAKKLIFLPVGDVSTGFTKVGAKHFPLPQDKHKALRNIFDCLQFLRGRFDAHAPPLDRKEISMTSAWAEFDNLLSRVLQSPCTIGLPLALDVGFCSASKISEYDTYLPVQSADEVVTVFEDGASSVSPNHNLLQLPNMNYLKPSFLSENRKHVYETPPEATIFTPESDRQIGEDANDHFKDSFSNLTDACRNFKRQWGSQWTVQTRNDPECGPAQQTLSVYTGSDIEEGPQGESPPPLPRQQRECIPERFRSSIIPPDCV